MTTAHLAPRSLLFLALAIGVLGTNACKPSEEGDDEVAGTETGTETDTGTEVGETTTTTTTTDTTTDTTEETTDTGPVCGDSVIEGDEQCDGTELGGQDCVGLGFFGGDLVCGADCMLDDSGCQMDPICGNGVVEGDEVCDTDDFVDATCESSGDFIGGMLACNDTCDAVGTLGCLSPGEGGMCGSDSDCPVEAPTCFNGACWNGSETDPCEFNNDCQVSCVNNMCWDGSEGDPCLFDGQCSELAPFCDDISMMCHDGSVDDPCESDSDCMDGTFCVALQCHAGVEGDPCEFSNDCADASPFCVADVCYDGSLGDPCGNNGECNQVGDAPFCSNLDDTCQTGDVGSGCTVNSDCISGDCDLVAQMCL